MPPKKEPKTCRHEILQLEPSRHASYAGFKWPTEQQRLAAMTPSGQSPNNDAGVKRGTETIARCGRTTLDAAPPASTFPAPLVLPYDDLATDPKWPPQPANEWITGEWRNPVTPERRTLYVAAPPTSSPELQHVQGWTKPNLDGNPDKATIAPVEGRVKTQDVIDYLAVFYHPLPVKLFAHPLEFTPWQTHHPKPTKRQKRTQEPSQNEISISTGSELIQIRNRPCPDALFPRQLNLCDLLDVAIEMLPEDAYSLLLLTDHDLYEGANDDFCCGRAFGGSRIACVSTARYLPVLDRIQEVDMVHSWPASHCQDFVERFCDLYSESDKPKTKKKKKIEASQTSPLQAAIIAYTSPVQSTDPNTISPLYPLHLSRITRTAAHELGHCFGLDHCVYYACSMQGTSSAEEDARQPPYLCPVDLEKVLRATGADERGRYEMLRGVCERWAGVEGEDGGEGGGFSGSIWAAHAAWIRGVLEMSCGD